MNGRDAIVVLQILVLFLFAQRVYAQAGAGVISGTITDNFGAAIPAATVTIINTQTQVKTDVTTNSSGFYNLPNLRPGSYSVSASAAGFKTVVRSDITLTVGAEVSIDLELPVGAVNESITVKGEVPDIEQTHSSLDYTVNSTTVRELPLNGRDWTQLSLLQPGVNTVDQSPLAVSNQRANRGLGTQLAIGGNRP